MLIEFDKMDPQVIPHMRGGEKEARMRMYADSLNKINTDWLQLQIVI